MISFATRQITRLCGHVSEYHPPPVQAWNTANKTPVLHLECPRPDQVISSVPFASFGTPYGTCGSFSHGECSAAGALPIVKQVNFMQPLLILLIFSHERGVNACRHALEPGAAMWKYRSTCSAILVYPSLRASRLKLHALDDAKASGNAVTKFQNAASKKQKQKCMFCIFQGNKVCFS